MSAIIPSHYSNNRIVNRSYCCLSLNMGVLTDALIHLWIFYLSNIVFSNILDDGTSPAELKFYQFKLPNVNCIFDVLHIVEVAMYTLGVIGCFKKSHKIIRYYKNYLWLECATILVNHIWSTMNSGVFQIPKDKIPEDVNPATAKLVFMVLVGLAIGVDTFLFAQSVYAAFVATWYERFLRTDSDKAEVKERKA